MMLLTTFRRVTLLVLSPLLVMTTAVAGHGPARHAGVSSIDVYADGDRVHVLAASRAAADAPAGLAHQVSTDGGQTWSPAVSVGHAQPPPDRASRGMDVQVAACGDVVVAAWETPGTDRWGGGPMTTAVSTDGGKTWAPGPNPADDNATTGHGFLDLAAADDTGAFHLVWLDSRTGQQGLRYARSTDDGRTWSANQTLGDPTCECCWNAVSTFPGGRVSVLYRAKSPRDMALIESTDGGLTWTPPVTVGEFNWQFDGCPHVGGTLTATVAGERHAVVWTGKPTDAGAYHVRAPGAGSAWPLTRLGTPDAWHPDLAARGNVLAATWTEPTGGRQVVHVATSPDAGATWTPPRQLSKPEAAASHPRTVPAGDGFLVVWTQRRAGEPARWESHRVSVP